MTSEEQVMALLEEGDPATRVDDSAWREMDASTYLALLRVDETTRLKDLSAKRRRPIRAGRVGSIAAVVTLVAGLAIVLLLSNNEEAPVVTNPPTPTTVLPTPTTAPTDARGDLEGFWAGARLTIHLADAAYEIVEDGVVTDSGTYEVGEPDVLTLVTTDDTARCRAGEAGEYRAELADGALLLTPVQEECAARGIARTGSSFEPIDPFEIPGSALSESRAWSATASSPGLYQTRVFQPPVAFVLPPDWRSPAPDTESNFGMERLSAWIVFENDSTETQAEKVSFFESHPDVNVIESEAVSVGAMDAVRIDFTVSSDVTLVLTSGLTGVATPQERVRAWFIDVQGSAVTVFFGTTKPTFDSMVKDAEKIIASIVWG